MHNVPSRADDTGFPGSEADSDVQLNKFPSADTILTCNKSISRVWKQTTYMEPRAILNWCLNYAYARGQ
jgi:hypothetical protein